MRDGLVAGLADNGKSARMMSAVFDDRTFVGDVRSSEMHMKRHSIPQVRTLLLEVAWGCAREKFAISASVDAAPAAVKAAQSSPVMLVSRLTINVARKSLRTATDTSEKVPKADLF